MSKVQFGYISRGALPYLFIYQNVILSGKGNFKIVTKSGTIYEGNSEENEIIKFTSECDNNNYMRSFKVNDKEFLKCREDPENLFIEYDDNMKCTTSTWTFADH